MHWSIGPNRRWTAAFGERTPESSLEVVEEKKMPALLCKQWCLPATQEQLLLYLDKK
jgi:hypothetical protein